MNNITFCWIIDISLCWSFILKQLHLVLDLLLIAVDDESTCGLEGLFVQESRKISFSRKIDSTITNAQWESALKVLQIHCVPKKSSKFVIAQYLHQTFTISIKYHLCICPLSTTTTTKLTTILSDTVDFATSQLVWQKGQNWRVLHVSIFVISSSRYPSPVLTWWSEACIVSEADVVWCASPYYHNTDWVTLLYNIKYASFSFTIVLDTYHICMVFCFDKWRRIRNCKRKNENNGPS